MILTTLLLHLLLFSPSTFQKWLKKNQYQQFALSCNSLLCYSCAAISFTRHMKSSWIRTNGPVLSTQRMAISRPGGTSISSVLSWRSSHTRCQSNATCIHTSRRRLSDSDICMDLELYYCWQARNGQHWSFAFLISLYQWLRMHQAKRRLPPHSVQQNKGIILIWWSLSPWSWSLVVQFKSNRKRKRKRLLQRLKMRVND